MSNEKQFGRLSEHDCWDFGADSNSMEFARDVLGSQNPIGINLEKKRLTNIVNSGYSAMYGSVLDIPSGLSTNIISMSHFVEHLPSFHDVQCALDIALRSAKNLIYISGPLFEDDDYVRNYGVKFHWANWVDHDSRTSLTHVLRALSNLGILHYTVSVGFPVSGSDSDSILDISEEKNKPKYVEGDHLKKPNVQFSRPAFQEFALCVPLSPAVDVESIHRFRHGKYGTTKYKLLNVSDGYQELRDSFLSCLKL